MLKIAAGPLLTRITGLDQHDPITYQLRFALSYSVEDERLGQQHRVYLIDHVHGNAYRFPTGLLQRAVKVLDTHQVPYEFTQQVSPLAEPEFETSTVNIRPYQVQAALSLVRAQSPFRLGGILQACTGSGKTAIAAKVIQLLRQRTLFLVHTRDLMYQAKRVLEEHLCIPVGQIGDGKVDIQPVTVGMVQSLQRNRDDFLKSVHLFIADEVHHISASTFYKTLQKCSDVRAVIGLSASPWRDDGHDMVIEAACGPVQHSISASNLIDTGFLVPPEITALKLELPPVLRTLKSTSIGFHELYKQVVTDNERRHRVIQEQAREQLDAGRSLLILVKHVEHGQRLSQLIPESVFLSGDDTSEVRDRVLEAMRNGNVRCLISTSILDEGVDVPRVDALILAGAGKSSTKALQRIGRVLRPYPDKTRAYVVEIIDGHPAFERQYAARKKIYLTEPRFEIVSKTISLDYQPRAVLL